jgi:2-dehydropantoate 2-reductase
LLRQAATEATKLARRKRIKLIYDDSLQKVESVCSATSSNVCSMLQDVLSKKRTEIDYINGAISRQARSSGVKTPVNDMFIQIISSIEESYRSII